MLCSSALPCFKIWDLDARGYHKGLWRLWYKSSQLLVIGLPYSPYRKWLPSFGAPKPIFIPKPTTQAATTGPTNKPG